MEKYVSLPFLGALLAFALILYAVMYFSKPAAVAPVSTTTSTATS